MENERFKPLIDRLFLIIFISTAAMMLLITVITAVFEPKTLLWTIPIDLFVAYFLISPLFGYVELRKSSLFIKFGFILKKEIPYKKIRELEKASKFYSESMLSLKCSFEHVNVKYNSFDVLTVSVIHNDAFIEKLRKLI